jgi:hypothetical protein
MKVFLIRLMTSLLIISLLSWTAVLDEAIAAQTVKIRQEINIIDAYLMSGSGAYATSSARVYIDTSKYNSAQYYFEVVASTTSAVSSNIYLRNASTTANAATITFSNANTYTLYRTQFTPSATGEYMVVTGNEAVQKGVKSARIIVLQNGATLDTTETQIEIGNSERYSFTAATSTFASPKYWFYDSSKWDGSPTFYVEVTYNTLSAVASSTTYTSPTTFTYVTPAGTASTSVGLWGAGGAGGSSTLSPGGGAGGAGGQFASSTIMATSSTYTLVVGLGAPTSTTPNNGAQGASTTWNGSMVIAGGGAGGLIDAGATTTGTVAGCVGQICFAGGNGGNGRNTTTQYGGGGGGGAGTAGAGGSATGAGVAGTGTLTGGGAGAVKNTTASSNGTFGASAGGGGSGGNSGNVTDRSGGQGGNGQALITSYIATTSITLELSDGSGDNFVNWTNAAVIVPYAGRTGQAMRVRSQAFVPVTGRNYRIAFKTGDNRTQFEIYNAKIIVQQTSPTKLEPQYLQANTKLGAGTALQQFLTLWDSNEWNTTNTFIHQVDAANNSTSVVELDTAAGSQITGSVVTSPDNRGVSSAMTMPAVGNIDLKATTNNSDVYSSRILVQATIPGATSDGTGNASRSMMKFLGGRLNFLGARVLFK